MKGENRETILILELYLGDPHHVGTASTPAPAATFVYVSNAEDGEIAAYAMQPTGR